jgi:hypothetical protein
MISILFILNLLVESFRKKITDAFPVILTTSHREEEFFLLMEKIIDFVIRQALKDAHTSARIQSNAEKTFDSFLELLKFGFEDPSTMSYDTLYKKTDLIVTRFFECLELDNKQRFRKMFESPYNFGDYIRFAIRSNLSSESMTMYNTETDGYAPTFQIEQNSQCVSFCFEEIGILQLAFPEQMKLFNLDEADFPDGYNTERELFSEEIESIEIEDKIERLKKKPFSQKKRKLRNSLIFA